MPLLHRESGLFPASLLALKPGVKSLSIVGDNWQQKITALSQSRVLTVVGSRKMTHYGQQALTRLLPPLIRAGVVIVSGFMYGVDQQAHQLCLDYQGLTVAVLGWGIDYPVLPVEQKLYGQIKQQGLLLSEYPKNTSPQLWMFPARDRLMAGLGQATLVIEAALKSGSLITGRYARQFKRKLFSVPGPITSTVSAGTNSLIKSGQALPVTESEDIFKIMGWSSYVKTTSNLSSDNSQLVKCLGREPLTIDELAKKLHQNVATLSTELSLLQLQGVVEEQQGKFYVKADAHQN